MSEVTTHQIKGVCKGVMLKGEWQEFHIEIGQQYPVKLATKNPDIQARAAAAGEQEAVWTYSQRDGNPNPHKPGEFFKNRYLEAVEVGGTLDPTLAQQGTSQSVPRDGRPSPEGRERSIERQTIIKAAISVFPAAVLTTEEEFFAFLTRLDNWISADTDAPVTTTAEAATPPATPAEAPPQTEDDIPF